MMEIQCLVTGKVQAVGFRAYVEDSVAELGLCGYIRNNPDGSVLVLAQGQSEDLRSLVEYLHEGSPLSVVEGVGVEWGTAGKIYDEFKVLA